jgi:L-lactate dehydrogenase complex protein LldG
MSARENIIARIRRAQGKPPLPVESERAIVGSHVRAHPASPRPAADADAVQAFCLRALKLSSTWEAVDGAHAVPAAVGAYLAAHALPRSAVCWPEFAGLEWQAAGMHIEARRAQDGDLVGITGVFCAIAETGTLMTLSAADTPSSVSLLPETHIAVVSRARIVRGMEEAWALLRSERSVMPRAVSCISGPSRTADIEQTVTLGAHGPYRVHIVLVP